MGPRRGPLLFQHLKMSFRFSEDVQRFENVSSEFGNVSSEFGNVSSELKRVRN